MTVFSCPILGPLYHIGPSDAKREWCSGINMPTMDTLRIVFEISAF
jgi:hypothetical protein